LLVSNSYTPHYDAAANYALPPTPREAFHDMAPTTLYDCPTEVIQAVFRQLDQSDVAKLRLTAKRYSEIGAEYLVSQIRFFTATDSIERLEHFDAKPALSKHVTTITYEGVHLALRCRHLFENHFRHEQHAEAMPETPPNGASSRAKRFYKRSMEKFEKAVLDMYTTYKIAYDSQQDLFVSDRYEEALSAISRFPKLRHLTLHNAIKCTHSLSKRFQESFPLTCAMPLDLCTSDTPRQLQCLLLPKASPLLGLESLAVHALSPKFFTHLPEISTIKQVFNSLKILAITFRLESEARDHLAGGNAEPGYHELSERLGEILASAQDLEKLKVNFDDLGYFGPTMDVKSIIGDNVWPKLQHLDVDCVKTDAKWFIQALTNQPRLQRLGLAFIYLSSQTWPEMIRDLKTQLKLKEFVTRGLLEDKDNFHCTNDIDSNAYIEDFSEMSLSEFLSTYVTTDIFDSGDDFNPFTDIEWRDPDDLHETFGNRGPSYSDIDMFDSDDTDNGDDSDDSDDSDSGMSIDEPVQVNQQDVVMDN
jgi:hypothetical protein